MTDNWPAYRDHWNTHAIGAGPEQAVTGLGDDYRDEISAVLKRVAPGEVGSVLDLGCGAGLTYPVIMDLWPEAGYMGCDISSVLLDHCKATHPETDWRLLDSFELPVRSMSVDLVVCHSV